MRRTWLYILPLLFLPNFGLAVSTPVGKLEVVDIILIPYLISVLVAANPRRRLNFKQLVPLLLLFVAWSIIGVMLIPDRYFYPYESPLLLSLTKIIRVALFGAAALLTAECLHDKKALHDFYRTLLFTGGMLGTFFIVALGDIPTLRSWYGNTNGLSVQMGMILTFFVALWLEKKPGDTLQRWYPVALPLLAGGILFSNGRGGWLALIAGLAYLFWRRGFRYQLIVPALAAVIILPVLYQTQTNFQREIDRTFFPDRAAEFHYVGSRNVGNIDDGVRLEIWAKEGAKWIDAPFLGTGYFHRGGESGLSPTGSHNYFLQILLETGLVGLLLIVVILVMVWKQAGSKHARARGLELPVRVMVVVASIGVAGGEYFYDGRMVLLFFFLYAPVGSLSRYPMRTDRYKHWETPWSKSEERAIA